MCYMHLNYEVTLYLHKIYMTVYTFIFFHISKIRCLYTTWFEFIFFGGAAWSKEEGEKQFQAGSVPSMEPDVGQDVGFDHMTHEFMTSADIESGSFNRLSQPGASDIFQCWKMSCEKLKNDLIFWLSFHTYI